MILEGSGITECFWGWNSMCQYWKCLNLVRSRGASPRLGYWLKLVHLFVNTEVTAGGQGLWNTCCSFKLAVSVMYVACEPQEMVGFGFDASSSTTFSALSNQGRLTLPPATEMFLKPVWDRVNELKNVPTKFCEGQVIASRMVEWPSYWLGDGRSHPYALMPSSLTQTRQL